MGSDRLKAWIGGAAIAAGALLPMLVLLPFGWMWLWQHGWTLHWFAFALFVSLAAFGVRLWMLRRLEGAIAAGAAASASADDIAAVGAPREVAAWKAVEDLAARVDPAAITSRDELARIGIETVEAVAHEMHPGIEDPVWRFTVPEALTLVERVSQRLRPLIVESVPLGDQLTVGQVLQIYKWRGLVDVAGRAYDVWRIIRMMNPVTAATQEIRERLSKAMMEGLRDELARRLATAYVREVGRAAIDLYSGRLRSLTTAVSTRSDEVRDDPARDTAPLRFLIAGRIGAGKSSLVNALAGEVRAAADALPLTRGFASYEVQRENAPTVELIDSRGIAAVGDVEAVAAKAAECDAILWVVAAHRPDRELDRSALEAVRAWFRERPDRRMPPVLLVATHIDRLRPFQDWSPPYDIAAPTNPKARTIRDAVDAASVDLNVPQSGIVPVCLSAERGIYNADLVWARLVALLPAARSAQLLRRIAEARSGLDWRRVMGQAAGAGRLALDVLTRSAVARPDDTQPPSSPAAR
ncbi:MAG: GTPase domain-containing protein [Hyphomicrobiaceae bacterium]|nr:GTPase domain-containing protein [Hyphomicrobiaceae bacterium]